LKFSLFSEIISQINFFDEWEKNAF
jgi:hypothetical protein